MRNRRNMAIYWIILLGVFFRIIMAIFHYTHLDDIGVANYLIHLLSTTENDEIGIAEEFCKFWTYGPLQSLITQKLVNKNLNYSLNIFMGRLPSLICNVLFILIIYKLLCKINSNAKYCIVPIIIISLSWENIIYSAQMESYAIGIMFCSIIVYFVIQEFYDNWSKAILAAFLFSVGCYAQYQIFILVFVVYVASFIYNIKNKKNLVRVVFAGAVNLISSFPLLFFLLNSGKLSLSVNSWNVGTKGIFIYQNAAGERLFDKIEYTVIFYLRNIFLCFKYLFLSDSFKYIVNILTVVLLICAVFGIYYIHKNKKYMIFALFQDILSVILLIMIISGSLTFGPSRHILFVEPIWIMLIYFGIIQLLEIKKINFFCKRMIYVVTGLIVLLFAFSAPKELATRRNLISEKYICNIINKYEPQFVFAEANLNDLYLFNVDGFTNKSEPVGRGWLEYAGIGKKPKDGDIIILMSKNYTIDVIKDIEHTMRVQLQERLNYFGLDKEWANLDNYTILCKKEVQTDAEVEYAREFYWNFPNGICLYVLRYHRGTFETSEDSIGIIR